MELKISRKYFYKDMKVQRDVPRAPLEHFQNTAHLSLYFELQLRNKSHRIIEDNFNVKPLYKNNNLLTLYKKTRVNSRG